MKKNKIMVLQVITLLVIFSSSVMAAVTREEFENAMNSFAIGMSKYSNRFKYTEDTDSTRVYLGYTNQMLKTDNGTMLYFSDDTFCMYLYHEVLGLDMSNGYDKVYEQKDVYKDIKGDGGAKFDYFDDISKGDWYIANEWDKYKADLKPGDMLIEKRPMGYGYCGMYVGDGKVLMFKKEGLKTYDLDESTDRALLKEIGFDVARIKDDELKKATSLNKDFDKNIVNVNAMTMADAISNLKLQIAVGDDGFIITNTEGKIVGKNQLVNAIRTGFLSEYGDLKNLGPIYIQLEYKDNSGNRRVLGNIAGPDGEDCLFAEISTNEKGTSNIASFTSYCKKFDLEDYKSFGQDAMLYWGYDYLLQQHHDLYAGIYIYNKSTGNVQAVGDSIKITNGSEKTENGEHKIECFTSLTDNKKDTLQDFLNVEIVVPEETYELYFEKVGDTQNIEKTNEQYNTNSLDEILFTVNKSGTYLVKIKSNNTLVSEPRVYLARYDVGNEDVVGHGNFAQQIIRNAGQKTDGTFCEDSNCKNVQYENGEYTDNGKLAFPLVYGKIYVLNTEKTIGYSTNECTFEIVYISEELIEIRDHEAERKNLYLSIISQSNFGVEEVHIGGEKDTTLFERFEFLISFCVRNIANGLVITMDTALGWVDENSTDNTVSIDTIIFDEYPLTKLNLFTKSLKPGEEQNSFIQTFAANINTWFANFTLIAVVAYLIILLYMGIRIVLNATAAKKSIYKEMFVQWVTGIIILFTFPIVIRYAIEINSAFVSMVGATVKSMDSSRSNTDYVDPDINSTISTDDVNSEESKKMELNPFDQNDKGYMAVMARRAHTTKRLSYALVYLIMTFQLVIIAVMYYKRLFMVAFLLVLFPVVMVAHVLEKVANIKTGGAFSKWTKEILITIFVQSIHAIIYSFASATVIAAGDTSNDWILMLVGVSFLFNGETILKKIIGYDSQSTPSLAQTAVKTATAIMLTKSAVTSVADNVIGAGSHLQNAINYGREAKKYGLKAKHVDVLGTKPKEYKMPDASKLAHFKPEYTEFGDTEAKEVGDSIQVLNNMQFATPEQLTKAFDTIERAKDSGKYEDLLKDLKMSDTTFEGLQNARNNAAHDAVSGHKTKQQIDMELTMELERLLPKQDIRAMKGSIYSQMAKPMMNTHLMARNIKENDVKREVQTARDRYNRIRSNLVIADKSSINDGNKELEERAVKLLRNVYGQDTKYTKAQYQMALSVCMLKNANSGRYDANELMTSANFAFKNQGRDSEFERMASYVGEDLGELRYVVAEAVCEKGYGTSSTKNREWRYDENKKMAPKDEKLTDVCKMARNILDVAEKNTVEREEELESGSTNTRKEEKRKKEEIRNISDTVSVVDVKKMGHEQDRLGVSEEVQIHEIVEKRKKKNTEEHDILIKFSKEMLAENNDLYENKIDGMTKKELEEMEKIEKRKQAKEIGRTLQTTTATIVGAPIGAAVHMGLSDDDDTLEEMLSGGLAGAALFDKGAEAAYSEKSKRKVKMRNPYTGEMEIVEVTVSGAFSDAELTTILSSELSSTMSNKLKEQFLQNKINRDKKWDAEKTAKLQKEEYKKRLDEAYKKAKEDAAKNNSTNNQNNS